MFIENNSFYLMDTLKFKYKKKMFFKKRIIYFINRLKDVQKPFTLIFIYTLNHFENKIKQLLVHCFYVNIRPTF